MALIRAICWGPQSTAEISSLSGTGGFVTSPALGAGASLQSNPLTTGTGFATIQGLSTAGLINSFWNAADTYLEFVFQVTTLPSADNEPICNVLTTAAAQKIEIRINSSGNLLAYNSGGTLLATGSTALSTGTAYRIGVLCGTGASGSWEVRINGSVEISGTGDLTTTNGGAVQLGKVANRNDETVDFYYGTVWIDDAEFKGAMSSAIAVPTANGSTMQWTSGTGGSDYQEADEIPPAGADTSYVMSPAAGGEVALFDVQDSATIGASGTIHVLVGLVRVRENIASTSSVLIRIRSGSTNSDSAARNASTTYSTQERQLVVDPDTSAAWTTSGIDGVEVGAVEANAVAQRMDVAYVFVFFTAAAGGDPEGSLLQGKLLRGGLLLGGVLR